MIANLDRTIRERYFSHVGGDVMGGLMAAIVALPLALAFGEASGMGATAGLYGAIAVGFFASMFGGTPSQISGPTGPMTVVAAAVIAQNPGTPEIIFWAIIVAGIFQILLGFFKAGQYIHYIPYPVISGFMTGIGVIIISLQLLPLLGHKTRGDVLESFENLPEALAGANPSALLIGFLTLAIIYGVPRLTRKIPSPLVALIVGTLAATAMGITIPVIGDIPEGFPKIQIPGLNSLAAVYTIMTAAITLALLGAIDSLLTSVVADKISGTGQRHNSDQELIGQGIGNIATGLIGGLPGAGATMRTVVNANNGGKTYLSGVIHSLFLLAALMVIPLLLEIPVLFDLLGGVNPLEIIPQAVLAGILISVGISIIDYRGLRSIRFASRADTAVMLTVLFLTVFDDLIIAVGIGIVMASILFVKNLSDAEVSRHGELSRWVHGTEMMAEKLESEELRDTTYVYSFEGPLFFGEAKNFNHTVPKLFKYKHVILHFSNVPMMDQTGAYALEDSIRLLKNRNIQVYLVNLNPTVRQVLTSFGILEHLDMQNRCFNSIEAVITEIENT